MQPARQAEPAPSLDDLRELSADDLAGLDRLIQESLHTDVALVSDIAQYIVTAGGKRLRPLIVMLACRALAPADRRSGTPDRRLFAGRGYC